jgi:hypothetical protein
VSAVNRSEAVPGFEFKGRGKLFLRSRLVKQYWEWFGSGLTLDTKPETRNGESVKLTRYYTASSGRSYLALPIRSLIVGYATVKIVMAIRATTLGNMSHFAP